MLVAGGTPIGGVFPLREGMGGGPRWFPYITTDDVGQTRRRIRELGGKVHSEPQAVGDMGSWALVHDPQGAEFCAWQYATRDAPPPAESVVNFSWHELTTTDH
jgi:predicted enzyme related to lactoylglutathione lyase